MNVFLVHGMGRSPLSLAWLGLRLRRRGHDVHHFGYSSMREQYALCSARLLGLLEARIGSEKYAVVGHSLGTVLLRSALPHLERPPVAAFFIAPPARACAMAKHSSTWPLFRFFTGEFGRLLADDAFMQSLPPAPANCIAFVGTRGPRHRLLPHGAASNDCILAVDETRLDGVRSVRLHATHTLIMNHRQVLQTIDDELKGGA